MRSIIITGVILFAGLFAVSCDKDIDEDNSSAKISGYVYLSHADPTGVRGVRVIVEADPEAENPYLGPDRWFETDENGYFEAYIFLGSDPESGEFLYVGDAFVQYFYDDRSYGGSGGITLSPGSHFLMPPLYLN
ncbi:hypothetical protein HUU59_03050 [bacterium]|nr:hypothetical protein [bacterium]